MLLIDTQIVLWLASDMARIPAPALKAMRRASESSGGLAIAGVTLMEISMLVAKGRVQMERPIGAFLKMVESSYHVIPIDARVAVQAMQFSPKYPKDPADRQIGATAVVHGLTLVTADRQIIGSGEVRCLK